MHARSHHRGIPVLGISRTKRRREDNTTKKHKKNLKPTLVKTPFFQKKASENRARVNRRLKVMD